MPALVLEASKIRRTEEPSSDVPGPLDDPSAPAAVTSSASTSSASKIRRAEDPSSAVPGPSDDPSAPASRMDNLEQAQTQAAPAASRAEAPSHASSEQHSDTPEPICHQCRRINPDHIYKCGSGCHACGETDCWRTNPKCKYKGKPVENHVDATQTGESAPDIFDRSLVEFSAPNEVTGRVTLQLTFQGCSIELWKGSASGKQNSCLIHSLMQAVFDPVSRA